MSILLTCFRVIESLSFLKMNLSRRAFLLQQNKSAFNYFWLLTCTRDDQKLLSPLYFGLPGNENFAITVQGNAISPSLFELSYPFKIEGLFEVPKYSFNASMTPSLLP